MHKIDQVEPFNNIVREKLWYIYYLRSEGGQSQLNDLYEMHFAGHHGRSLVT